MQNLQGVQARNTFALGLYFLGFSATYRKSQIKKDG
jgi:hypothetical protein